MKASKEWWEVVRAGGCCWVLMKVVKVLWGLVRASECFTWSKSANEVLNEGWWWLLGATGGCWLCWIGLGWTIRKNIFIVNLSGFDWVTEGYWLRTWGEWRSCKRRDTETRHELRTVNTSSVLPVSSAGFCSCCHLWRSRMTVVTDVWSGSELQV